MLCRARWPLCFSVALLGQEHANNTAPFAVIGSLASMDTPVGGEVRELARERLPEPAVKLVLRSPSLQAAASLPCTAASNDSCCLQGRARPCLAVNHHRSLRLDPAMLTKPSCSQERPHEPGSPTLRIMMDPAERAHLLAVMQQRSEAARAHRQAPGMPGLPEMSPNNQQRLPRWVEPYLGCPQLGIVFLFSKHTLA